MQGIVTTVDVILLRRYVCQTNLLLVFFNVFFLDGMVVKNINNVKKCPIKL